MVAVTMNEARSEARYFYVWMSAICVLVAFGGFAGTYWLQVPAGTFVGPPLLHLHAALFSGWTLLFFAQTWQAAAGRIEHHRAWGVAGAALVGAMVVVGFAAALNSLRNGIAGGYGDASRGFMIIPVTAILLFAGLVLAALLNVSRPDWHKRIMLVATVSILQAAMARVFLLAINGGGPGVRPGLGPPPPIQITIGPALVANLLIVAGMIYDWRTRGRPHPAYLWAGGVVLAVQVLRIPLSTSAAWGAVAGWLETFLA
jgi:hypothetical protein